MMKLLLDTEVLYTLLTHAERFSTESIETIQAASGSGDLCVSVASLLQLREARRSRLITGVDLAKVDAWMDQHVPQVLPIDVKVLTSMTKTHEDQELADRIVLATARREGCRLATFREYTDPDIEFLTCHRT